VWEPCKEDHVRVPGVTSKIKAGLSEPTGTGPDTVGTGGTGLAWYRFRPVDIARVYNLEIEFKKMKKISKHSQKYFKVCRT
jgi:hypothetical protein